MKEALAQLYKTLGFNILTKITIFNTGFNYITTHKYNLTLFNLLNFIIYVIYLMYIFLIFYIFQNKCWISGQFDKYLYSHYNKFQQIFQVHCK